jgi:hypothetical protein
VRFTDTWMLGLLRGRQRSGLSSTIRLYSVYLLYSYKSTNTDSSALACDRPLSVSAARLYSVYLLYSYKSTNTDSSALACDRPLSVSAPRISATLGHRARAAQQVHAVYLLY